MTAMTGSVDLRPTRGRPLVMGILNVTPDSFSDGGRYDDFADAVGHGLAMVEAGADIIDVGGESTRPGALRPSTGQEQDRVLPVIEALAGRGITVSVDTMRADVAAAALAAGAQIVNDVSGGLADPGILEVVADHGPHPEATYVAMHWRGHSDRMAELTHYPRGVVAGVRDELAERLAGISAAGVATERVVLDPGLGFAKTAAHNWELLAALDELGGLGRPLLVGASRKSFLGQVLAGADGTPRPVDGRELAHAAVLTVCGLAGVWGVRVHDVPSTQDVLAATTALVGRGLGLGDAPAAGLDAGAEERPERGHR